MLRGICRTGRGGLVCTSFLRPTLSPIGLCGGKRERSVQFLLNAYGAQDILDDHGGEVVSGTAFAVVAFSHRVRKMKTAENDVCLGAWNTQNEASTGL
jgi:hypothetical protein